jgi:hypothetical protein
MLHCRANVFGRKLSGTRGAGAPRMIKIFAVTAAILSSREFGAGSALGGGYVQNAELSVASAFPSAVALWLPSLELRFFAARGHSIDLSLPVANMIVFSALLSSAGFSSAVVGADLFYDFNLGSEKTRLLVGPGLGLSGGFSTGGVGVEVRVPAVVGVELLSDDGRSGVSLQVRPFASFDLGRSSSPGGGVMVLIALNWYSTSTGR